MITISMIQNRDTMIQHDDDIDDDDDDDDDCDDGDDDGNDGGHGGLIVLTIMLYDDDR